MGGGPISESRVTNGLWSGQLEIEGLKTDAPDIGVFLKGQDLGNAETTAAGDRHWKLQFPIPSRVLADGISTFVFVDRQTSEPLGRFCIVAGDMAEQEILAQLDALQSEIDQLKSAFRREARRSRSAS